MSVVFKYKSPLSQTYAPGLSRPGTIGPDGIKGKSGNALYFIDFDLDNSYNIEQALQKIESNKVLSINSDDDLIIRKYKVNDIILSNTGKCYRIKDIDKDSLFSNYSFDIEYLGEMNKQLSSPVKFVVIYDFTNAVFYKNGTELSGYSGDIIKMYGTEELSCYITNRTEKPYTSNFSIDNKDYSLIGSWIKIVGYSTEDTTPKFDPIIGGISGAKHSFVIQLNNNKNISCNSIPVTYNEEVIQTDESGGYSINFKKKLEYPNIKIFDNLSLSNKDFVNSLLYEIIPDNNIKVEYGDNLGYSPEEAKAHPEGLIAKDIIRYNVNVPECTTVYLSDYSMDDMHPSGNNIRCTINNDRNMWYRSGIKAGKNKENTPSSISSSADLYKIVYTDTYIHEKDDEDDREYNLTIKKDILESLYSYGAGFSFTPINLALKEKIESKDSNGNTIIKYETYKDLDSFLDSSTTSLMSNTSFPHYAIGLSLSTAKEDDIQKELNSLYRFGFIYDNNDLVDKGDNIQFSNIIQYPKYPSYITNTKYFSNYKGGNSLYFSGMNDVADTYENIFNYITDKSNTFNIITTFEKTKEMIINVVPIIIDTSFKNSKVYLTFGQGFGKKTLITGLRIRKNGQDIVNYTYK